VEKFYPGPPSLNRKRQRSRMSVKKNSAIKGVRSPLLEKGTKVSRAGKDLRENLP